MAKVEGKRACSVCGTLLPDDSALCPVCVLRLALETRSDSAPAANAFISHSNKDEAIADAICQHLESAGVPCWIAPKVRLHFREAVSVANSRLLKKTNELVEYDCE